MEYQKSSTLLTEASVPAGPDGTVAAPSLALRYGVVLPLAGIFTVGLTLSMASLIATEFSPQDKTESVSFEINPLAEDIAEPPRTEKPDPLKKVETPPPPPVLDTVKTVAVELPHVEIPGKKTEFDFDKLDLGKGFEKVAIKRDFAPVFRAPPVFPSRFAQGDVSGYCRVRFDINPEGKPFNIGTTICTDVQLKKPTISSVQKWKYSPQVEDGRPVSRYGLETTIRFVLNDERGQPLPLPAGY
jgi:protein TonB